MWIFPTQISQTSSSSSWLENVPLSHSLWYGAWWYCNSPSLPLSPYLYEFSQLVRHFLRQTERKFAIFLERINEERTREGSWEDLFATKLPFSMSKTTKSWPTESESEIFFFYKKPSLINYEEREREREREINKKCLGRNLNWISHKSFSRS